MTNREHDGVRLARRRFVLGMACGGMALGAGLRTGGAWARPNATQGRQVALTIDEMAVDFTGRQRMATVVNGQLPAPLLRWKQGDEVAIRVTNRLREPSSIHWHGLLVPYQMDGVPGLSFAGIAPGETFTYRFRLKQSGTYWYHAHSGGQEQTGLYGPIVIEPAAGERFPADREHVVLLSDWSDTRPETILANLRRQGDYYNRAPPTVADLARDARAHGLRAALDERRMWNAMRMSPTDLSDVTGSAYTYLMNGTAPAGNWTGTFAAGETVRLRVINGAAMTIFDLRIPGLAMRVVATDGQDTEPVSVDEFRIAPGETFDVLVTPEADRAYCLFAQAIDRSGYARGTLAPRAGMPADVPPLDAREWLDMQDMMGAMDASAGAARHAREEFGNPGVDMRVDAPRTRLDDPGVGLRGNGRRVLTYADLHTIGGPLDAREPGREIELHLTGSMERYLWSFDGVPYERAAPIRFRAGERLRMVLVNDTMMHHPIHLHGMWSELADADGRFQVRKHTVNVQPAQRVQVDVSADALGRWAYHCHMLYHMDAGMMREVVVA